MNFDDCVAAVERLSGSTPHRLASTADAVAHVHRAGIPGCIVECGVWKGANMVLAALVLKKLEAAARHLWLYDTFEGMTAPCEHDIDIGGNSAASLASSTPGGYGLSSSPSIDEVSASMASTGYPKNLVHTVKGDVLKTLPDWKPDEPIAVLRLDTDFYESTDHTLKVLYPLLAPGGVLIVDDYGHWKGCQRAVDQYFSRLAPRNVPHLVRVDYTCRVAVKP